MDPKNEIERMKKDIAVLQAIVQLQSVTHPALLGAVLSSVKSGEHGAEAASVLMTSYYKILHKEMERVMATVADEHPDLATEIHNIFQEIVKKKL